MRPSHRPSIAEQGSGRRRRQASQLALAGKVWSEMCKKKHIHSEQNSMDTTFSFYHYRERKWVFFTLLLVTSDSDFSSRASIQYMGMRDEMDLWDVGARVNVKWCTLLRYRCSRTAVGAGGTSVEALSSLLTGSSLLHTASSMPVGKVVYRIKYTIQHVLFERLTNIGWGNFGRFLNMVVYGYKYMSICCMQVGLQRY